MANGFDIGKALKLVKEGREPITAKEADKFVGRKIATIETYHEGKHVQQHEGVLKEVGYTFHPQAIDWLQLDGKTTWYEKRLFGWKRTPYAWGGVKDEKEMESSVGTVYNVEVLFSDGVYYPVHVGKLTDHREYGKGWQCEYCIAQIANDWTKLHKEGAQGFNHPGCDEGAALKKVLKRHPKEFKAQFGEETFNELAKAVLKR